jgi:hypothetical protein
VSRLLVFFLAVAGLAACSSEQSDPQLAGADPVCMVQAQSRADDAAVNGFGPGLQQKIYAEAYKDCVAWASKSTTSGFR